MENCNVGYTSVYFDTFSHCEEHDYSCSVNMQSLTSHRHTDKEREREECSAQTGPTCKVMVPVQWVSYNTQGFMYTYDNTTYLPTVAYIIPVSVLQTLAQH